MVFNENIGQVSVEVATMAGASVQCLSVLTPNGLQVYIPNVGNYIVTFTLSNGDEYYGEFTVTDWWTRNENVYEGEDEYEESSNNFSVLCIP